MAGAMDEIQRHPLLQPPVLEVLFAKFSLADLATCRLVCKDWRINSLSPWRTNTTIKFKGKEIVKIKRENSPWTTSLADFLEFWESDCVTNPFKQFHISKWDFLVGALEQARFLELVGQHVTTLTFEDCSFGDRSSVQQILYRTFPNLQFLKIEYCQFYTDSGRAHQYVKESVIPAYKEPTFGVHGLKSLRLVECQPDSMMELLSHFHMLNNLHVEGISRRGIREVLNTIKVIRTEDHTKLPIKQLDLGDFFLQLDSGPEDQAENFEHLNLLQQLNLPLHRLFISLSSSSVCELKHVETIKNILRQHSSSLRFLEGTGNLEGLCREFPFGQLLTNLEEVQISVDFSDSLNWLKYTPNLRVLDVMEDAYYPDVNPLRGIPHEEDTVESDPCSDLFSNSFELDNGNWTLSSLKSLTFPNSSADNLRKLSKWMPNLETLKTELDDEKFAIVCEHWKELKYLKDIGWELSDEGVTGLGMNVVEEGGGEPQIAPNITQIKNLAVFKTSSRRLTVKSVYDGFLKMPSLEYLHCNFAQIDDETLAAFQMYGVRVSSSR